MSNSLVSVLIPCYNAERWIGETLESILQQHWPEIEIVVVNDGSTDGSRAVLERFRSRRLTVVDQENRGQTAALNRCVAEANGSFVQYLDADDVLHPEKIERQVRRLQDNLDCVAMAEWARFRQQVDEAAFSRDDTWADMHPLDWLVANWRDGGGMMYPAMWLVPRSLVDGIGPWREDLTLGNDTEYFTRAVLAARSVLFCEGARSYYRSGIGGSLSGLKSGAGWESQFAVLDACERHLLQRENSERTRRACSMLWQRLAHGSYPYQRRLANRALVRAKALHTATLSPEGGLAFRVLSQLFGWKAARMAQRISGRT